MPNMVAPSNANKRRLRKEYLDQQSTNVSERLTKVREQLKPLMAEERRLTAAIYDLSREYEKLEKLEKRDA